MFPSALVQMAWSAIGWVQTKFSLSCKQKTIIFFYIGTFDLSCINTHPTTEHANGVEYKKDMLR